MHSCKSVTHARVCVLEHVYMMEGELGKVYNVGSVLEHA